MWLGHIPWMGQSPGNPILKDNGDIPEEPLFHLIANFSYATNHSYNSITGYDGGTLSEGTRCAVSQSGRREGDYTKYITWSSSRFT